MNAGGNWGEGSGGGKWAGCDSTQIISKTFEKQSCDNKQETMKAVDW